MTGTTERGSFSKQLIERGQMELLPYPVHQNLDQMCALAEANSFDRVIACHTARLPMEAQDITV